MALLYNKGHNFLTSAFPQKYVRLIKFPLKKLNISLLKEYCGFLLELSALFVGVRTKR